MSINARSWYSGTPEPDSFKHSEPGRALLVALDGHGAPTDVTPVMSGLFEWPTLGLSFPTGDDAGATLRALFPAAAMRRQVLLRLVASGHVPIAERLELDTVFKAVAPEFGYAELNTEALITDCAIGDLDLIDQAGALRQAAEMLLAESEDESHAADDRNIARDALVRLFSYCRAMER